VGGGRVSEQICSEAYLKKLEAKAEELEAKLKVCEEAIKFYANIDSWKDSPVTGTDMYDNDCEDFTQINNEDWEYLEDDTTTGEKYMWQTGGKLARQTLKKIKEVVE
jgi:hypothetical protein